MTVLIYLDVCCLNRPLDNQTQERVRLESEAVLIILGRCQRGEWTLVGSEVITLEISQTRDSERKLQLQAFTKLATQLISVDESIEERADLFIQQGLGTFDALHIACAEARRLTVFLTTDDRLMRWAVRRTEMLQIKVANPVNWLLEVMIDANP